MKTLALAALSIALFVVAACDGHTGPSDGITVHEHPDFGGDSRTFDGNAFDLDDIRGPCLGLFDAVTEGSWDDCISSIEVSPGWEVTVFEHDEYEGESLTLTRGVLDLDDVRGPCGGDWDDCISSLQVRAP